MPHLLTTKTNNNNPEDITHPETIRTKDGRVFYVSDLLSKVRMHTVIQLIDSPKRKYGDMSPDKINELRDIVHTPLKTLMLMHPDKPEKQVKTMIYMARFHLKRMGHPVNTPPPNNHKKPRIAK